MANDEVTKFLPFDPDAPENNLPWVPPKKRPHLPQPKKSVLKPRRALNKTERAVRNLLIKSKGAISKTEIAEQLGINRSHVWRCIAAIRRKHPIPSSQYDEAEEVRDNVAFYDDLEDRLMDEIAANDDVIAHWGTAGAAIGFHNVRLGLLNQLQMCRAARTKFMLDIGLLQRVPEELIIRNRMVADMDDEAIYHEISAVDAQILELEHEIGPRAESAGDEAPAPVAEAEGDDQLQGS